MNESKQNEIIKKALKYLIHNCGRLKKLCYWAGTCCIAIEELHHRVSFDLDFHTKKALIDIRPILAEIQMVFTDNLEIIQAPDELGSSFRGIIILPDGEKIILEILSNYEDVPDEDLVNSKTAPGLKRITLKRYLEDKIQCIVERLEAKDFIDIYAVLKKHPDLEDVSKKILTNQDAILLAEKLLAWTDKGIMEDLTIYNDINPNEAITMHTTLLKWLKELEENR